MPLLLKVDVEGFEPQVLAGAKNTLSDPRLKAIIIETLGHEIIYGHAPGEVHQALVKQEFRVHSYEPFTRALTPDHRSLEAERRCFNSLYIRDMDFVQSRISQAPLVEVLGYRF